jgi:hypothetical protein
MKRLIQILLITFIVFNIFSCENPVELKFYTLSGVVFDKIYWDSTPYVMDNAPVVLDGDRVYTNLKGEYSFTNVREGAHTISVIRGEDYIYKETIIVSSNTIYNINILGNKEDYFPIDSNYEKDFKYNAYNYGSNSFAKGKATWKLGGSVIKDGKIIYTINENIIYESTIDNWKTSKVDTSYSTFEFIEDSSNVITIKSLSYWNGDSFSRYNAPNQGEIISINYGDTKISLKRNVGIYRMEKQFSLWGFVYELIE